MNAGRDARRHELQTVVLGDFDEDWPELRGAARGDVGLRRELGLVKGQKVRCSVELVVPGLGRREEIVDVTLAPNMGTKSMLARARAAASSGASQKLPSKPVPRPQLYHHELALCASSTSQVWAVCTATPRFGAREQTLDETPVGMDAATSRSRRRTRHITLQPLRSMYL